MGVKQIFKGIIILAAIVLASASLNYTSQENNGKLSLHDGSIARLEVEDSSAELFFFFSANCRYCEQVLESMDETNGCTTNFNPVEKIDGFNFPGAKELPGYLPDVNRDYLGNLGIKGIPVLQMEKDGTLSIIRGATAIKDTLTRYCDQKSVEESVGIPEQTLGSTLLPILSTEDGCLPQQECEDEIGTSYNQ